MTQYAHIDPNSQQVIGWIDTDTHSYPTMPDQSQLHACKNGEWHAGDGQVWYVVGGSLTIVPPPLTLAQVQSAQIESLTASYQGAIQKPVAYMGTTFQADFNSQDLMTKCIVAGAVPAGFYWQDSNNVQVPMTFTQLQGLAGVILQQGQPAFTKFQTYKAQVRAATTVDAVRAVVWA